MDNKIKVVLAGCGNMGSSHARAYKMLNGFDIVGLVDVDPQRRDKLATELGEVAQFDDLDLAIEATQPQAVAICTYPDTHSELAIRGLNTGLHVFVEKPIASTVKQARQVAALAREKDKKVVVV